MKGKIRGNRERVRETLLVSCMLVLRAHVSSRRLSDGMNCAGIVDSGYWLLWSASCLMYNL